MLFILTLVVGWGHTSGNVQIAQLASFEVEIEVEEICSFTL